MSRRENYRMSEFLMKPKIDFAFKELMMDEQTRIGFLSAVLNLQPSQITKTEILNTNLRKQHEEEKQGILDIRIRLNDNTEIDIEIQLAALRVWADRALFYLAKMYVDQIKPGDNYTVFKKCVSISILDFKLFEEDMTNVGQEDTSGVRQQEIKNVNREDIGDIHCEDTRKNKGNDEKGHFYSCFHIREDTRNVLYTDKMEFHVMELPKLPRELKEDSSAIELWGKFISAERKEDFEMVVGKNIYIDNAYRHLQFISQDEEKRMEYEAREKAIRDYNQGMFEAEQRGVNKGLKQGRAEGLQIFIIDQVEDNVPKEKTIEKLKKRFDLSQIQAEQAYKKYANQ